MEQIVFKAVALGCDHGGLQLKEAIAGFCEQLGIPVTDFGTFTAESVDYPIYAAKVCKAVLESPGTAGILCCGTGIGMSIAANKCKGIRAAVLSDDYSAEMTRRHNDANVLCLGGRVIGTEKALELVNVFLHTAYEGGRHQRRLDELEMMSRLMGEKDDPPAGSGSESEKVKRKRPSKPSEHNLMRR